MNELRIERALRAGPPFATPYRAVALRLELTERPSVPAIRRLAIVALVVVAAIAGGLVAISGMFPTTPTLAACPTPRHESEATDSFVEGLAPAQRSWHGADGAPAASTAPGVIAAFTYGLPDAALAVDTIDPTTGTRCRLVTFARDYQVADGANTLDWSPSGDALAIGFDGQLFLWTRDRLLRVWTGDRFPRVAWSPDSSSVAVWNGFDGSGDDGRSNPGVHLIHADGRPDRMFDLDADNPGTMELSWSPDASRWVISLDTEIGAGSASAVRLVSLSDGSVTPLDLGLADRTYRLVGWPDSERFIVRASIYGSDPAAYLVVPVANPSAFATLAVTDEYAGSSTFRPEFSPDLSKLAISRSDEGALVIVDAGSGQEATLETGSGEVRWAWSPDSRQVVFQTDQGIFTVDLTGADPRQLATGNVLLVGDPWQPEVSQ